MSTESRSDPAVSLRLAGSDPPTRVERRIAIYVYGRTTLALACPEPICLQAFLGPVPDVHFDAGSHTITVEPGVYLVRAGHAVDVTGDDIDVVAIVDGRPARRTPRRLAKVMPALERRKLARFLRRAAPAPRPRPRRELRRILAVDEDTAATSRYARGFGPERTVLEAADPATARELARSGPLDLAIVELRIRTESGIELARELKRDHPDLVVALCSGYLTVEAAVAAVHAGVDVVLFKPVTAQEILRRVGAAPAEPEPDTETLEQAEWEHISRVLADCGGNISMAAARLGIYRSSLQRRIRRCGAGSAGRASAPSR